MVAHGREAVLHLVSIHRQVPADPVGHRPEALTGEEPLQAGQGEVGLAREERRVRPRYQPVLSPVPALGHRTACLDLGDEEGAERPEGRVMAVIAGEKTTLAQRQRPQGRGSDGDLVGTDVDCQSTPGRYEQVGQVARPAIR